MAMTSLTSLEKKQSRRTTSHLLKRVDHFPVANLLVDQLFRLVYARALWLYGAALDEVSSMWLFGGHFGRNGYKSSFSSKPPSLISFPVGEKYFHASSSFVLPSSSSTQKSHGYLNHKNNKFYDAIFYDHGYRHSCNQNALWNNET